MLEETVSIPSGGVRRMAWSHGVVPDDCQQAAMQDAELLTKHPSDNQQRFDQDAVALGPP